MTTEILKRLKLEKCLKCRCLCTYGGNLYCAYNEIPDACEHYWKKGDWQAWENREGEPVQ